MRCAQLHRKKIVRLVNIAVVAAIACLAGVNFASAHQLNGVQFSLVAPGAYNNFNIGVNTPLGSDSNNVGVHGFLTIDLDYNPTSGRVNSFRIADGSVTSNNGFTLNPSIVIGVNVSQVSGDVVSNNPPTQYTVDGTDNFVAANHKLTINSGTAVVTGIAPSTVNFANSPVNAFGTGNGTFTSTPNGNFFDGVITLPVSATSDVGSGSTITLNGTLRATGSFAAASVPEPTSGLFLAGLAIAAAGRRRRRG